VPPVEVTTIVPPLAVSLKFPPFDESAGNSCRLPEVIPKNGGNGIISIAPEPTETDAPVPTDGERAISVMSATGEVREVPDRTAGARAETEVFELGTETEDPV
jgi:hypothetical protein